MSQGHDQTDNSTNNLMQKIENVWHQSDTIICYISIGNPTLKRAQSRPAYSSRVIKMFEASV